MTKRKISILLVSLILLFAVVVLPSMSQGANTGGTGPNGPSPAPSPTSATLYRIVGCKSFGNSAYFNGPDHKEVAFGFDDGPWFDTLDFVKMLEANHVQATFFMIGDQVTSSYQQVLKRELLDGDVLGDHTYTHPDLTTLTSSGVYNELNQQMQAVRSLTGYTPCVFRPPYGAYNQSVVSIARSLGLATVLWNVDPSDYLQPGTTVIASRVLSQVQPGSIIISHDGGGPRAQTLAAYPTIIQGLKAKGYKIVTIPQLLGFRPIYIPCIKLCYGIGIPRSQLPKNAIINKAP